MYKIILMDLDGVVLKKRGYFSDRLATKQEISVTEVLKFFRNEYKKAVLGQADIKTELPKYFKQWQWRKGLAELLEFWFAKEKQMDKRVMKIIDRIRRQRIEVFLVSDNERHRKEYLIKQLNLNRKFDRCIFSCDLGMTKSQASFFRKIINRYKIKPSDIFYWDDDKKNISSAKQAGIKGKVFKYRVFKNWTKIIFDKS